MKWYLLFSAEPNGGDVEGHLAFVAGFRQQVTLLYNSCIQSNVTFLTAAGNGFFL